MKEESQLAIKNSAKPKRGRPVGSKSKKVKAPTMKKKPVKTSAVQFSELHVKQARKLVALEEQANELRSIPQVKALYSLIK